MTTLGTITYDAVANGAAVPDAASGGEWDVVTGTIVGSTTYAESSTRGSMITGQATCRKTVTTTNKFRMRWFHEQPVVDPGANTSIAVARSSSTVRAQLRLESGGTYRLIDGSTAKGTSSGVLQAATRDRLEWWVNGDTGQQGLEIYRGANRHGTTPDATLTPGAASYTNATVDNIGIGLFTTVAGFVVGQDSVLITDVPGTQIGGTATPATAAAPAVAAVATVLAPTISLSVTVAPAVVAAVATVPTLIGQTGSTVSPDPVPAVAAVPAPTVVAVKAATVLAPVVVAVVDFPPPQLLTPVNAIATPAVVTAVAAVGAVQRAGAPVGNIPALDDLIFGWLSTRTTGATTADRERNYYAAQTGLPASTTAISTLKRTYYGTQLGLTATQTAQRGLTSLEIAYWQSVNPANNTGSWQDRARKFYGG